MRIWTTGIRANLLDAQKSRQQFLTPAKQKLFVLMKVSVWKVFRHYNYGNGVSGTLLKSKAQGNLKRKTAQGNLVHQRNTGHSSVSRLNETSFATSAEVLKIILESSYPAELDLIEDKEAVIRTKIKGRSPN